MTKNYSVREITERVPKDEFGPENVYEVFDPKTEEIKGWVVIDNTARSPKGTGKGGTAMYPEVDLAITLRKARVMTWKQVFCSPVGEKSPYEPWGGAKGGIVYNSKTSDAEKVLRAWAKALASHEVAPARFVIPDKYIFGLDVGLKEWATKAVVEELGGNPRVSTGKPVELGGIPYDELGVTGYGLVMALKTICSFKGIDFGDSTIVIQGFGAVGAGFAAHLLKSKKRPRVVGISDWGGAIYNPKGIDLKKAIRVCCQAGSIIHYPAAEKIRLGDELYLPVDILLLAYKEDQITSWNVGRIQADIILQGANSGVTPEAEEAFHQKRIYSPPDFVVNSGASTIVYVEYSGGTAKEGLSLVKRVIQTNTRLVLEESKRMGVSSRTVALRIAQDEVRKAMFNK